MKPRELEQRVLSLVSKDEMWKHCTALSTIHRQSGTEGDYEGVDYIVRTLKAYGVPVEVFTFQSLVSYPVRASMRCLAPEEREIRCKTRAFSAPTPPQGIQGELVFVPTEAAGVGILEEVAVNEYAGYDVKGKIVLTERGGPDGLWDAQKAGAMAMIHMWASDEDVIHEMICSPVWGTPTPESAQNLPAIPTVSVTRADGMWLRERLEKGPVRLTLRNDVERHWRELRMPVATVTGGKEPEKFALVGGHLDSWYVGVTDNATGNACLLELARVFNAIKADLDRSIRVGWWPGHSYGRYSGSTWYCDHIWQDLHDNCLVYDNIDSPGVLGATDYSNVTAMPEAKHLAEAVVKEVTGQDSRASRPARAGDQSFWGTGATSLFMLLSDRPAGNRAAVGGSGGGWWWHSEYDTLDKADPERLVQDTQMHALALLRVLQSPVPPFKLEPVARELRATAERYAGVAAGRFDFGPVFEAIERFAVAAGKFDVRAGEAAAEAQGAGEADGGGAEGMQGADGGRSGTRAVTSALLKALRAINPVVYTLDGPFDQDPATPIPTMPGLHLVTQLDLYEPGQDTYGFLLTRLVRERNRVVAGLIEATEAIS